MAETISMKPASKWVRVLRPLLWWLLLMLGLFGIRTHQRLMEQTRLGFAVSLQGQVIDAAITLDGQPAVSGQNISLGEHMFTISHPKADTFTTNFFAWYGRHDFGEIKLKRGTGTLNVQASPPAAVITITGPEFSTTLSNSSGMNLTVPTDSYTVRADYQYWSQTRNVLVSSQPPAVCVFAPQLGALHLTSDKDEVTYSLWSTNGQSMVSGNLPVLINGLPMGAYQLLLTYHHRELRKPVFVEAGTTNDLPVQFVFGAAHVETVPSGAEVHTLDGKYLGQTPLDLADIPPQTVQLNLSLAGYESVSVTLQIIADQTATFQTNLVSTRYLSAMREAKADLAAANYQRAAQAASEALNAMPGDADALALQAEAGGHVAAEQQQFEAENATEQKRQAQLKRPREIFDTLCHQNADANLFTGHELKTEKPAQVVADAIATALTSEPRPFELLHRDSPEPDNYTIMARQTFSLGILGGSERVCLLVVGQAKPDETQIYYKVLEYQVKAGINVGNLLTGEETKEKVPVSQGRMKMTDAQERQIKDGVRLVSERIHAAIGQVQ